MFSSAIKPPLAEPGMHFANVVDEASKPHALVIDGKFTTKPFANKFGDGSLIYFKPDDVKPFASIDNLFEMDRLLTSDWRIMKALKAGEICLKLLQYDTHWVFTATNLNLEKGAKAKITLNPGLYFNSDTKTAGVFYKLVDVSQ